MDFWQKYDELSRKPEYGTQRLHLSTNERYNASIARLSDRAIDIDVNHVMFHRYSEGTRYLMAKEITFDILISMYDVNMSAIIALRVFTPLARDQLIKIGQILKRIKNPNIELRYMGLQNGSTEFLNTIENMHQLLKPQVVEVDLFGNEERNIIIDLKTGTPYNLLLLNRIYKPGELANTKTKEEVFKSGARLIFV